MNNAKLATNAINSANATNASMLGGVPAGSFLTGSGVASISVTASGVVQSSRGGATVRSSGAGASCIGGLSFAPAGGAVTLDAADPTTAVAFMTVNPTTLAGDHCPGQAVILTHPTSGNENPEAFSAILY